MNKILKFVGVENKAEDVYSQFSFDEFWNFISPDNKYIYEMRMKTRPSDPVKDYVYIRDLGQTLKLPYHHSGVFVKNANEYKNVCAYCYQNKLTLYISAHPKRKSYHSVNDKFKVFNGKMQSDLCIYSLFIDFDASTELKENPNKNSAEEAYLVAKKFLTDHPNIKKYLLLCSGNGVQLRIPLDHVINMPQDTYDSDNNFVITEEFSIHQKLCKEAMRITLNKYSNKEITVDLTSLELARVGRSPFSRNWKNESNPKYCGVIEICDEQENEGLYDYIMGFYDKINNLQQFGVQTQFDKKILAEFSFDKHTIRNSRFVRMLVNQKLPEGGRNNVLFFQFKLLLKDNNINPTEPEIRELMHLIEARQGDKFPSNSPADNMHFNPEAIINWCVDHNVKPIYPVLYNISKKIRTISPETMDKINVSDLNGVYLPDERNVVRRITKYIREHEFRYHNEFLLTFDLIELVKTINTTFGYEKTEYLLSEGILKTILEKV